MFETFFNESLNKPFYKLLPQNETSDWSPSQTNKTSTNSEEMTDINLSTMEFNSYSVSKYCHKKKVEKRAMEYKQVMILQLDIHLF